MKKFLSIVFCVSQFVTSVSFANPEQNPGILTAPPRYLTDKNDFCDGYPRIQLQTLDGLCVGLVAGRDQGLKMPRYAVQDKNNVIYVSDMGGWVHGRGTIWAIEETVNAAGMKQTHLTNLFPEKPLTMPNGLLVDPQGRIYVGTPVGIYRFKPTKNYLNQWVLNSDLEMIEDQFRKSIFRSSEYVSAESYNQTADLGLNNRHPLIQLAANRDFTEIYFNVGAPSDRCTNGHRTIYPDSKLCIQSESEIVNAGIWKINLDNSGNKISTEAFARGLRNSMALVVHPQSGFLLQGENSLDLPDEDQPYEEINFVQKDKHYGWPYCYSDGKVLKDFVTVVKPEDCKTKYSVPIAFMPAHTAPLGMVFYQHDSLVGLKNKMLVSWHGYRTQGQKVVMYDVDQNGLPTNNQPKNLIFNWTALGGVRSKGAPVGLTILNDGTVLIMDDKNTSILRLAAGQTHKTDQQSKVGFVTTEKQKKSYSQLYPQLQKNCMTCHSDLYSAASSDDSLKKLIEQGLINPLSPEASRLFQRLKAQTMPPKPNTMTTKDYEQMYKNIDALSELLKNKN